MLLREGETTDPELLGRLNDWANRTGWDLFMGRYDPMIRRYCRRTSGFDGDLLEELCQRIRIELARRLVRYQYDPSHRFRAWLKRLCHSRAVDMWRQRRAGWRKFAILPIDRWVEPQLEWDDDEDQQPVPEAIMNEAERVQGAVRARVDERTWGVFWQIVIEGRSVRETAEHFGMSYAAAFAAQKRVRRMLRQEANRSGSVGLVEV